VDDDDQLNKMLIQFGSDEVKLKNLSDGKSFTPAQLKDMLDLLKKLDRYSNSIRRHGGDFEAYLGERNPKTNALPKFLVRVREGNTEWVTYFPTDVEVTQFDKENQDLNIFGVTATETNGETDLVLEVQKEKPAKKAEGVQRRAKLVELYESDQVEKLIADLGKKGLKVDHYSSSDKPIFELTEGEGDKAVVHPVFSIPEILQSVIEIGKKGLSIQRFKGLGEMNPKQLFETTMNPEKRKMLRVELGDAVEADNMFVRLMGDVVEPRRQYIEDNALNARLDV
jgi:DNA gyrase subunit B